MIQDSLHFWDNDTCLYYKLSIENILHKPAYNALQLQLILCIFSPQRSWNKIVSSSEKSYLSLLCLEFQNDSNNYKRDVFKALVQWFYHGFHHKNSRTEARVHLIFTIITNLFH